MSTGSEEAADIVEACDTPRAGTSQVKQTPAQHSRAVLVGTLLALVSAVFYTLTNMCLRAAANCDIYWVSCIKAAPTFVIAAALVASRVRRGAPTYPSHTIVAKLFLTGLVAHIGGNVAFQYGLGVVGLAAAVPLTFSTIIVGGAVLGRVFLHESITYRSAAAMGLLCASIALLGWHTELARPTESAARFDAWTTALAVGVTCASGLAYSILGVVIRRMVTGAIDSSFVLLIISISGVLSLGLTSLYRLGPAGIAATGAEDWTWMIWAGVFNAGGFFLLTKALHLIPVAYVNVVNASQTAMAAVAGVLYFRELTTAALAAGVALMLVGILLMERPRHQP
ncbi:MAG: DMT family transporter [Planctomycetaceae bacterium]|nr:DMT family transporter [Planctomycetaceae bacterium]